jgi:hypothetical protein
MASSSAMAKPEDNGTEGVPACAHAIHPGEPQPVAMDLKTFPGMVNLAALMIPGHGLPGHGISAHAYEQARALFPGACPCMACLWQEMLTQSHMNFLKEEVELLANRSGLLTFCKKRALQEKYKELQDRDANVRQWRAMEGHGHCWRCLEMLDLIGDHSKLYRDWMAMEPQEVSRSPSPVIDHSDEETKAIRKRLRLNPLTDESEEVQSIRRGAMAAIAARQKDGTDSRADH